MVSSVRAYWAPAAGKYANTHKPTPARSQTHSFIEATFVGEGTLARSM
jgi:hypothetical protein